MRALVDGDVIRYSVGFASQKNIHSVFIKGEEEYGVAASFEKKKELNQWLEENGLTKEDIVLETRIEAEPVENCLHSVKLFLSSILERVKADDYTIYLTGEGNFREKIATILPYKGNRDSSHKPIHYDAITDYLLANWKTEVINGMEADDSMAINQSRADNWVADDNGDHCLSIICSIDKDLDMVPGWHYNWNNDEKYFITEEQGIYNFYKQLLTGDATDNIQGIPKCGTKTAEKILDGMSDGQAMLYAVVIAYEDYLYSVNIQDNDESEEFHKWIKDSAYAMMLENGRLLWMVRELDEDGKPVMWKPPI